MNIFVCVDDQNGMLFNHRRQSRDRLVLQDILARCGSEKLWVNHYSAKLFEDSGITIDDGFLHKAAADDWCFVEDQALQPVESQIGQLVLYKWNRRYPADLHLDLNLTESSWKLIETCEFPGYSHEKITVEVYRK